MPFCPDLGMEDIIVVWGNFEEEDGWGSLSLGSYIIRYFTHFCHINGSKINNIIRTDVLKLYADTTNFQLFIVYYWFSLEKDFEDFL